MKQFQELCKDKTLTKWLNVHFECLEKKGVQHLHTRGSSFCITYTVLSAKMEKEGQSVRFLAV